VDRSLRFGVIGLRRGQSFVRACRAVGGLDVVALYDVDGARAEEVAAGLGGVAAFGDFEAFLAAGFDAVVVASPVPFHAGQSAAALTAGKHVLSEVTACQSTAEARSLAAAARASDRVYMMAENYRFLDEVELVKRMHDDGRFGAVYYAAGEYLHDCRDLYYDEVGNLTWRGRGLLGVYCTHSLGPLLYILNDRVATVSALAVPGGKFDPLVDSPTMHLLQMVTDGGVTFRVRVDHVSPRPHQMAYYDLQGTGGCYEAWRGFGDASKVWLADEHQPSRVDADPPWHALADYAPRYIPDRLAAPPEARVGGHGTSEYWLLKAFAAAVRGEAPCPIDVDRALDYTLPGVCAVESAAAGGAPVAVVDSRRWGGRP
jgi:predicted dehydrogenase